MKCPRCGSTLAQRRVLCPSPNEPAHYHIWVLCLCGFSAYLLNQHQGGTS